MSGNAQMLQNAKNLKHLVRFKQCGCAMLLCILCTKLRLSVQLIVSSLALLNEFQ